MELAFGEHAQEDVLGEDVLQQHLANIGGGDVGADGLVALLQEGLGGCLVGHVASLGGVHGSAQVVEDSGQVGFELLLGLAELLDLRQFVVEEAADQAVQFARAGHIHPHCFFPILEQHGGLGVFENYVVAGVAAVELLLDFGFQIVVGVLGFPVAAGHAQGVFYGAVGEYAGAGFDLRNQPQLSRWSRQ